MSFFDGANPFVIDRPVRLIELFAGIGAQAKAVERLGIEHELYKVSEWDVCPTLTTVQSGGTEAKVVIRVKENTARGYSNFAIGGDLRSIISEQHDPARQNPARRPRLADAYNRERGNLRGQI